MFEIFKSILNDVSDKSFKIQKSNDCILVYEDILIDELEYASPLDVFVHPRTRMRKLIIKAKKPNWLNEIGNIHLYHDGLTRFENWIDLEYLPKGGVYKVKCVLELNDSKHRLIEKMPLRFEVKPKYYHGEEEKYESRWNCKKNRRLG
ncbi:MAG: hypothetical protein ACOCT9_02905 [archaeon]